MNINLYCGKDVQEKAFNESSVRNLALLYYPCESFSQKNSPLDSDTLEVVLDRESDGSLFARVTLTTGKGSACFTERERELPDTLSCFGLGKTLAGRAFVRCGESIFGYTPPFGILTGVRPAKLILPYVASADYDRLALCDRLENVCLMSRKKAELICDIAQKELEITKSLTPRSASLYVSIPFCPTRCRYCSFVSCSTPRLLAMIPDYVNRLCKEISHMGEIVKKLEIPIKSVYIGGGTPSVLDPDSSQKVISSLHSSFDLSEICEFTYEAGRPDTVTEQKLEVLRRGGVSRISINTQTSNNEILKAVGRNHTFEDYLDALTLAKSYGFDSINTDLIAGLPGESVDSFKNSLLSVIKEAPDNITVHSFSVKRAADYKASGDYSFAGELSRYMEMLGFSQETLMQHGYNPYYIYRQKNTVGNLENTGFAKDGKECLYNICMMEELHTVFSVGAGAVTKLVSADGKTIKRTFNHKYPYEYLADDLYLADESAIREFYSENFESR